jgi:hypothetical protein
MPFGNQIRSQFKGTFGYYSFQMAQNTRGGNLLDPYYNDAHALNKTLKEKEILIQ